MLKKDLDNYIKIGDPMDMNTTIGPLVQQRAIDSLRNQIQKSIDKGAKVSYGHLDYKQSDPNLKEGFYFHPMILENITKE